MEKEINKFLTETIKLVNPAIEEVLSLQVDGRNQKVVDYQIWAGGKRLRPALTIIVCQMLGGKKNDVLYPAAGLEILHNYTLIIDDIIDKSSFRRGEPTTWKKFGKSIANCISVDYGASVFQAAKKSKYPVQISEIFAETMKKIVDGEILDILFEKKGREDEPFIIENRYKNINEKDYLDMVGKKSSALFQACCEIGAICADAKPEQIKILKDFAFNLGIAFQVKDDILDIFGEEKKFGKKIGHDIKERKGGNIIILFALQELNSEDKNKLSRILCKQRINKEDIEKAVRIIKKTNSLESALKFGEEYIKRAKNDLKILPQNKWNDFLKGITDFTLTREK